MRTLNLDRKLKGRLACSSNELSNQFRDPVAEGVAKVCRSQFHFVELCSAYKNHFDQDFIWWRYGDSNPGPLACHAIPAGSGVFGGVQEVLIYKAFSSCQFTADHTSSEYLLTESLT